MIVDKRLVEEEPEVTKIPDIPGEQVTSDKGYYHGVYFIINFNKENDVYRKEEHVDVVQDNDEEEMEGVKLDYVREHHWRMVFEDNYGGADDKKVLINAKRWDVYMN